MFLYLPTYPLFLTSWLLSPKNQFVLLPSLFHPRIEATRSLESSVGSILPKSTQLICQTAASFAGGIGRHGQGRRLSIATMLKHDRKGLGADTRIRSRITHFGAKEANAVVNRLSVARADRSFRLNRKEIKKRQAEEKKKEVWLRRSIVLGYCKKCT